jgi:hypothetical protein
LQILRLNLKGLNPTCISSNWMTQFPQTIFLDSALRKTWKKGSESTVTKKWKMMAKTNTSSKRGTSCLLRFYLIAIKLVVCVCLCRSTVVLPGELYKWLRRMLSDIMMPWCTWWGLDREGVTVDGVHTQHWPRQAWDAQSAVPWQHPDNNTCCTSEASIQCIPDADRLPWYHGFWC